MLPDQEEELGLSRGSLKRPHSHRYWSLWGNLTTMTAAGEAAQLSTKQIFLESTDDDFLTQVVKHPTSNGVLFDLILAQRNGLEGVEAGGSLGCSSHDLVELSISQGGNVCK